MTPDHDVAALIDDCQAMRRLIAPELGNLYLVEHPPQMPPIDGGTLAYMSRPTPLAIRDQLIAGGQWRGQGPCIAVLPDAIAVEEYGDHFSFDRLFRRSMIHELAHAVPARPPPADREPTHGDRARQYQRFAAWASSPASPHLRPWAGHGARFIRRALHLYCRALDAGYSVLGAGLCAGPNYALSDPREYFEALGDEPDRFAGLTFAEIEARPPPRAFAALWQSDKQRHHQQQERVAA